MQTLTDPTSDHAPPPAELEDHPAAALFPLTDVDGPEFGELVEDHRDAAAIGPCEER